MKLIVSVLIVAVMLAACSCGDSGHKEESAQTELANVELSVAAFMAAPDVPIRDLSTDTRILSYVSCTTPVTVPNGDADDTEMLAASYTRTVDDLINVDEAYTGGVPAQPLTDFTNVDTVDNWYCVYDDGKVASFSGCIPRKNCRDNNCHDVCNPKDKEGPNYWLWIGTSILVVAVLLAYYFRGWHFDGRSKT